MLQDNSSFQKYISLKSLIEGLNNLSGRESVEINFKGKATYFILYI